MEGKHKEEIKQNANGKLVGSRILPTKKGKRANVKIQKSSIFRPSVHVDKEGVEFINFLQY